MANDIHDIIKKVVPFGCRHYLLSVYLLLTLFMMLIVPSPHPHRQTRTMLIFLQRPSYRYLVPLLSLSCRHLSSSSSMDKQLKSSSDLLLTPVLYAQRLCDALLFLQTTSIRHLHHS